MGDRLRQFEQVYRAHVGDVTRFFARRCAEPQVVADLTADTFVRAMTSFSTFDPGRGDARVWLFGIARRVFAAHCAAVRQDSQLARRFGGRRELAADELDELNERIDAERAGRVLLAALDGLAELDREAIELVDLVGMKPHEAAAVLGVALGTMRMRLHRARARLRETSLSVRQKE